VRDGTASTPKWRLLCFRSAGDVPMVEKRKTSSGNPQTMMLDEITTRICTFLESIGIPVEIGPIAHETFLPGIAIRNGGLTLDPGQHHWPGDLLHEAGHIAVTAPELRAGLGEIAPDGGAEMAAIAWSYAAGMAIGIAPTAIFHDAGYRGGGAAYADAFASGRYFGVPLLQYWEMTTEPHWQSPGRSIYPAMDRWLR
jgi:hypothetical protein